MANIDIFEKKNPPPENSNSKTFHMGSVLIDVPKDQHGILGIVVLMVHVLYNTGGTALVVIWNGLADQM